MHKTLKERKEANLKKLHERTQKIALRREIKKVVKEQIILERKKQLNEGIWDSVLDFGQIALDVIGTLPPLEAIGAAELADAANAAIHFTRGLAGERIHFLYGLLSLISVIPIGGDVVAKPMEYLIRLGRLFGEESAVARNAGRIAKFIGDNSQTINASLRRGQEFIVSNKSEIERAVKRAHAQAQNRDRQQNTSMAEQVVSNQNSEFESDSGNAMIDPIVDFILGNDRLREAFADPRIVDGIMSAYEQLVSMFDRVIEAFRGIAEHDEEELTSAAQQIQTEALKKLNESKTERVSLKVLF